jgi:hypothetical protein
LDFDIPEANTYVGGLFFIIGTILFWSSNGKTVSYRLSLKFLKQQNNKKIKSLDDMIQYTYKYLQVLIKISKQTIYIGYEQFYFWFSTFVTQFSINQWRAFSSYNYIKRGNETFIIVFNGRCVSRDFDIWVQ